MGRHSEFTPLQWTWLDDRKNRFHDSQKEGTTSIFWQAVIEEWYQAFPLPSDTPAEGRKAHVSAMTSVRFINFSICDDSSLCAETAPLVLQ